MKKLLRFTFIHLTLLFLVACGGGEGEGEGEGGSNNGTANNQNSLPVLNQHKDGDRMGVSIYYQEEQVKKPTLYFVSGWNIDRKKYEHLYRYLVKQGYVVVAASYNKDKFAAESITDDYFNIFVEGWKMCEEKGINDDTRIGLIGHSAGAGILPSLGYKFFVDQGMGSNGRFIFGAAPWVDFQYNSNRMFLPADTLFVTEIYEKDHGTEPNIYLDMYQHIDVNHKTLITVKKESHHYTISDGTPVDVVSNGIYKPLGDLANYAFKGSNKATIFTNQDSENDYLHILAEGTLPSNEAYKKAMEAFTAEGSRYPCRTRYQPNPRLEECQNYVNSIN